jgi:cyclopropane-fatty-acyl-phospholipid synthase
MLYKFKSKATGDVIMLEPQGRQILQIIGKSPEAKGIVLSVEMPDAIQALRDAVAQEEAALAAAEQAQREQEGSDTSVKSASGSIRLKQRVVPFIDMLQRAHAEEVDVVWGV